MTTGLAVDLRPTGNGHRGRGIGRYVAGLMSDFISSSPHLIVREHRAWTLPRLRSNENSLETTWLPRPNVRFDTAPARLLRGVLERRDLAAIHLTDPYLVEYAPRNCPWIVTVYDLIQWDHDNRLAGRFRRGLEQAMARPDSRYVAISETTASAMVQVGVRRELITVLYPGPTDWPAPIGSTGFSGALVVGALDPHKRPDHAREAAEIAGVPILFAGRHEPGLSERWGIGPDELRTGADDATLAQLIRDAACVVHASEEEGFGLPVLEALALGTPVAAYDLPVTREIVGPDYPLVSLAAGPEGLADIVRLSSVAGRSGELLALSADAVARFDWVRSRSRRDDLYRAIHEW